MYKIDVLESTNLKLVPYSTNDLNYVCKVHEQNDYFIWDDIDKPKFSTVFVDRMNKFLDTDTFGWICWLKNYVVRVGIIYYSSVVPGLSAMLHPISDKNGYRSYLKSNKSGGKIKIMDEALALSLKYTFDKFRLLRVTGGFFEYNSPVISLCKRVGFKEEGLVRNGTLHNGKAVSIRLLGLLKEELPQ